jgi:hypothetical protein
VDALNPFGNVPKFPRRAGASETAAADSANGLKALPVTGCLLRLKSHFKVQESASSPPLFSVEVYYSHSR